LELVFQTRQQIELPGAVPSFLCMSPSTHREIPVAAKKHGCTIQYRGQRVEHRVRRADIRAAFWSQMDAEDVERGLAEGDNSADDPTLEARHGERLDVLIPDPQSRTPTTVFDGLPDGLAQVEGLEQVL